MPTEIAIATKELYPFLSPSSDISRLYRKLDESEEASPLVLVVNESKAIRLRYRTNIRFEHVVDLASYLEGARYDLVIWHNVTLTNFSGRIDIPYGVYGNLAALLTWHPVGDVSVVVDSGHNTLIPLMEQYGLLHKIMHSDMVQELGFDEHGRPTLAPEMMRSSVYSLQPEKMEGRLELDYRLKRHLYNRGILEEMPTRRWEQNNNGKYRP
jgi:hypothetical protein